MRPLNLTILTPKVLERFFKKIEILPDSPAKCWIWRGRKTGSGYGAFHNNGHSWIASRLAYFIHTGNDPRDLLVCHTCDVRLCCNPRHFFLGTYDDNQKDMAKKGRAATGSRHATKTHPEMVRHGEKSHLAKLKPSQVMQIRKRYREGGISASKLGAEFGVGGEAVYQIVNGKNWKHLPVLGNPDILPPPGAKGSKHPAAKITEDDVHKIRELHTKGMFQYQIARLFDITPSAIQAIVSRRTWNHVL